MKWTIMELAYSINQRADRWGKGFIHPSEITQEHVIWFQTEWDQYNNIPLEREKLFERFYKIIENGLG